MDDIIKKVDHLDLMQLKKIYEIASKKISNCELHELETKIRINLSKNYSNEAIINFINSIQIVNRQVTNGHYKNVMYIMCETMYFSFEILYNENHESSWYSLYIDSTCMLENEVCFSSVVDDHVITFIEYLVPKNYISGEVIAKIVLDVMREVI